MSTQEERFMWLIVFFDLPVKEDWQRRQASQFRVFLKQDGYMMLQLSVYARVCRGQDQLDKHFKRVEQNLPQAGSVRSLQITDRQFGRMKMLLGKRPPEEEQGPVQLLLF